MMLERLRSMSLVGWAVDSLATKVTARRMVQDDAALVARHGSDHHNISAAMQKHAADLEKKTKSISI